MRLTILGIGMDLSPAVSMYAQVRLETAVRRFADRIETLMLRLSDCNGTRGGSDKVCRIEASLGSAGIVCIEQVDENAYVAVDQAATRLKQVIARRMRHRWEARRPRNAEVWLGPDARSSRRSPVRMASQKGGRP